MDIKNGDSGYESSRPHIANLSFNPAIDKDVIKACKFKKGDLILGKFIVHRYRTEYVSGNHVVALTPLPVLNTISFLLPHVSGPSSRKPYLPNRGCPNVIYHVLRDGTEVYMIPDGCEDGFDFYQACEPSKDMGYL
jgi:hypothetical protein